MFSQQGFTMVEKDAVLRFGDCHLEKFKWDSREDADEFSRLVECQQPLTELDMTGTSVGIEAAGRLAEALATHPELTHAVFCDMFKSRMKNEIPPALQQLCTAMQDAGCELRRFDISDNAMGPIGAEGFKAFLRSPASYTLEDLGLNNLGLGITGGKEVTDALLDCHRSSAELGRPLALKKIVVGRNRQEGPGAKAFAAVFRAVGTMESVTMHQNGITPDGIVALADALLHSPRIRLINLSDNTCKYTGAKALAKVLERQREIEEVVLEDCLLKNAGASALIVALRQPDSVPKLKRLSLNGNEIGPDVAIQLIDCLKNKPSIEELSLCENCFGGRFTEVQRAAQRADFDVLLGSDEDDQGTASEEDDEDEAEEADEADDEQEDDDVVVVDEQQHCGSLVDKYNVGYDDVKDVARAQQAINQYIDAGSPATGVFDSQLAHALARFIVRICHDLRPDDRNIGEKLRVVTACCETIFVRARDRVNLQVYYGVTASPPACQIVDFVCQELAFLKNSCSASMSRPVDLYGPLLVLAQLVQRQAFSQRTLNTLKFWITDSKETSARCTGNSKKVYDQFNNVLCTAIRTP